jgi:hypothetical protein
MKPKYEKPMFRNLGEALPNAAGVCNSGTIVGAAGSCEPGATYQAKDCGVGSIAKTSCTSGSVAKAGSG